MKVLKKQKNSHHCIICGMDNLASVKAPFYEMEDGSVVSTFQYKDMHQSYPGRCHGGMITSMLDELIGRALWVVEPDVLAVTATISVRFLKPVPLNEDLIGVGKLTKNNRFLFEAEGFIKDKTGKVLATATATYFKLPQEKISEGTDILHDDLFVVPDDVTEIDL